MRKLRTSIWVLALLLGAVGMALAVSSASASAQTNCSAASAPELKACIDTYNAAPTGTTTTITLVNFITLSENLVISNTATPTPASLVIEGGGYWLDANNNSAISNVLRMSAGNLTLRNTTLKGSVGDGLEVRGGVALVENSTITENRRGIVSYTSGGVTVVNSTITANTGDGIVVGVGDVLTVDLSTIAFNDLDGEGPVKYLIRNVAGSIVTLTDSVVFDFSGGVQVGCLEPVDFDGGGNIVSDTSCTGESESDIPVARELANNGCSNPCTQTLANTETSKAIDRAGDCSRGSDQRGVSRTAGSCDSGAFESADCTLDIVVTSLEEFRRGIFCFNRSAAGSTTTITLGSDIVSGSPGTQERWIGGTGVPRPTLIIDGAGHSLTGVFLVGRDLTLRDLSIKGADVGLLVIGDAVVVEGVTFESNLTGLRIAPITLGEIVVENSTFVGNDVAVQIDPGGAVVRVLSSTLVDNGTALSNTASAANVRLAGSLLARNTAGDCPAGAVTDRGGNVFESATCTGVATPTLGGSLASGLAPNGCTSPCTQTVALLAGSPAIDAAGSCSVSVDQRGVLRPSGRCDAGAFEVPTCNGKVVTIVWGPGAVATSGDDVILGTSGVDVIDGLGGDDMVCGLGGDDVISGGDGDDVLLAGNGDDRVFGGEGKDRIRGQNGDDLVNGNAGNDNLNGNNGDDEVNGGTGHDYVAGNDGYDTVTGGDGTDTVNGGGKSDVLRGGRGNDTLRGNGFSDTIYGSTGNDFISGGDGPDLLFGENGNDLIDGNRGNDTISGASGFDTCTGRTGFDTQTGCEVTNSIP